MSQQWKDRRVAVALGASFMGYAAHAGFLAGLAKAGLKPMALGGSSAGAIAAGLSAAGLTTEQIREVVLGSALPWSFVKGTFWGWHHILDILTRRQPSLFETSASIRHFESLVGRRQIEDLRCPRLLISMTALPCRTAILAETGPLARAMAASCAVPLVFSPLEWEGCLVSDGGVVHEAPVDPWFQADDVDVILVHRIQAPERPPPWLLPLRMVHTIAASHHCVNDQWLADRAEMARLHGKEFIVITTRSPAPSIFSRRSRERCYAAGQESAAALAS